MQLRAVDAVRNIIEHAKLRDLYDDDDYEDNDNFALANLNGVINIAQRFATLKEFYDFANRASHASRKSKHAITLGTIHSAKGLEWDNVFVIGAQDGRIPHEKATDLHEERCIFYVAVSRPSKVLQVSYSGQRSRFLDEIEAEEELA
jgi:superfamily I DNA/RNA helicase